MVAGGVYITYKYKDDIIHYFITEANKRINTPINVKKIDVSLLENFPNISILLNETDVRSSIGDHQDTLGYASQIQLAFNLMALLKGQYELNEINVIDGVVTPEINEQGIPNYEIIKKSENKEGTFELKSVLLDNVKVIYQNKERNQYVSVFAKQNQGKFRVENGLQKILLTGNLNIDVIRVNEEEYFKDKTIAPDFNLVYDPKNKFLTIDKGYFKIGEGEFDVKGDITIMEDSKFDLSFDGVNTTFQTILSVLPENLIKPVKAYKSKGEVYFNGTLNGILSEKENPHVVIQFGAKDASFYHPDYKKRFEHVNFTGIFTNGNLRNTYTSSIQLDEVNFVLENEPIRGNLILTNFKDPYLEFDVDGKIDIKSLFEAIPKTKVKSAFGKVDVNMTFSGKVDETDFKQNRTNFKTSGEIILNNVSFVLKGERLPFNHFNGSFIFKNDDLAISNFSGKVGQSDFRLNGFFKNTSGLFYTKNKYYNIEADLRSNHLDFDELLKSNFASRDTVQYKDGHKYKFHISPHLILDFNCHVKSLKFKRFKGRNILGDVTVKNQIAILDNIHCQSMGGNFNLSGSVNARAEGLVEVLCEANLSGVNPDSIFYVFDNFDQDWLKDDNLRGRIYSDINTYMLFDNYLTFNSKAFRADISASIRDGELLDFEPMQKLSKFVEEESLAHLSFSELRNEIKIEDRTIYLPEMEVISNVSSIQISGTHTFDQKIDYRLAVPLKNFLRIGKIKEQNMVRQQGGSKLLLKITGTTDDYKISYDTEAVKEKIVSDIKKEGRELRETFENKGKEESEIQLEEEEYFDFDNE